MSEHEEINLNMTELDMHEFDDPIKLYLKDIGSTPG